MTDNKISVPDEFTPELERGAAFAVACEMGKCRIIGGEIPDGKYTIRYEVRIHPELGAAIVGDLSHCDRPGCNGNRRICTACLVKAIEGGTDPYRCRCPVCTHAIERIEQQQETS